MVSVGGEDDEYESETVDRKTFLLEGTGLLQSAFLDSEKSLLFCSFLFSFAVVSQELSAVVGGN